MTCACKGTCDPNRGRGQGRDCERSYLATRRVLGFHQEDGGHVVRDGWGHPILKEEESPASYDKAMKLSLVWMVVFSLIGFACVAAIAVHAVAVWG